MRGEEENRIHMNAANVVVWGRDDSELRDFFFFFNLIFSVYEGSMSMEV